jgi:hypothetical protein
MAQLTNADKAQSEPIDTAHLPSAEPPGTAEPHDDTQLAHDQKRVSANPTSETELRRASALIASLKSGSENLVPEIRRYYEERKLFADAHNHLTKAKRADDDAIINGTKEPDLPEYVNLIHTMSGIGCEVSNRTGNIHRLVQSKEILDDARGFIEDSVSLPRSEVRDHKVCADNPLAHIDFESYRRAYPRQAPQKPSNQPEPQPSEKPKERSLTKYEKKRNAQERMAHAHAAKQARKASALPAQDEDA